MEHWLEREIAQWVHHEEGKIAHTTAFVTPVVEHWQVQEIAQWVHHEEEKIAHATAPVTPVVENTGWNEK